MGTMCVGHSITDVYPLAPYPGQKSSLCLSGCPGDNAERRVLAGEGDGLAAG